MDANTLKAVIIYIKTDIELSNKMLGLLNQERIALEKHDTNNLGQIIESKSLLLLEMNNNQAGRDTLQMTSGFTKGFDGFKDLISSLSDDERNKLDILTDELSDILLKINNLSQANEKLIAMQNNQINRVLQAMHGITDNLTYGDKAQKINSGSGGQTLTKA